MRLAYLRPRICDLMRESERRLHNDNKTLHKSTIYYNTSWVDYVDMTRHVWQVWEWRFHIWQHDFKRQWIFFQLDSTGSRIKSKLWRVSCLWMPLNTHYEIKTNALANKTLFSIYLNVLSHFLFFLMSVGLLHWHSNPRLWNKRTENDSLSVATWAPFILIEITLITPPKGASHSCRLWRSCRSFWDTMSLQGKGDATSNINDDAPKRLRWWRGVQEVNGFQWLENVRVVGM